MKVKVVLKLKQMIFWVRLFLFGMEPLKFHMKFEGWRSGFGMLPLMLKP